MARLPRRDEPDALHHVMNRGLARRPVFEDRECMRYFKSRIAHATRRSELEVHAFSILTTHFHLLVRSPNGRMAEGMRRIQNEYVRWFNRRNRRDGPLFRGRFQSRRVESVRYRRILMGYIDRNPVSAGLSAAPESYEYGSARHYASQDGPPWLTRDWAERDCVEQSGESSFTWTVYQHLYLTREDHDVHTLVEQRLQHPSRDVDPLDELVHSAPLAVLQWMRRKALLADGGRPGLPCVTAQSVSRTCRRGRDLAPWMTRVGRSTELDLWGVLEVGLLRDLSGLRWLEIAQRVGAASPAARRRYEIHRTQLSGSERYSAQLQMIATELLITVR